jgi:hypothetical protein
MGSGRKNKKFPLDLNSASQVVREASQPFFLPAKRRPGARSILNMEKI